MASLAPPVLRTRTSLAAGLRRADLSIAGPRVDALVFWGAPLLSLGAVVATLLAAGLLPQAAGRGLTDALVAGLAILTYAHLIAVAPRAYLNRDVLAAHTARLTIVPLLVLALLLASPVALAAGLVLAVFWDVHHSAMQTFGLGRIYDMKAGNDPHALRRVDLLLNSALYIGPIAAGASMVVHFESFDSFKSVGWTTLTTVPTVALHAARWVQMAGVIAWIAVVGAALVAYHRAGAAGYRLSPHKQALLLSTAITSILAWGLAPPALAFLTVNLFHAVQYFALVWLKEGGRMRALVPARRAAWALPLFVGACVGFGVLYWHFHEIGLAGAGAWLAPFVACSLLHFWYDGFVWSVRRKLV